MKIGILTSGGDCPGLNAVIRGFAKYVFTNIKDAELIGISEGYLGLIEKEARRMKPSDFSGILNVGGTILDYKELGLDVLVTLGGAGTHKTAALLSSEGLNVVGIPKTIDNDIWGTDVTFGFHTAVDIATECIDRIHTTAASHGRTMLVELMGNKVGWLTLYAGIAGGADIILLPEIPYDPDTVVKMVKRRLDSGKAFNIIAIAEGAMSKDEAKMKKAERLEFRNGRATGTEKLAAYIEEKAEVETRVVVPGHLQRGGSPSPYDRFLSTEMGSFAGELVKRGNFGVTVAMRDNHVTYNKLEDIAGKAKSVPLNDQRVAMARAIGIYFGDEA